MAEANLSAPERPHIHLLDDGFQHRQLHRDVNILLLDDRDVQDHLLPAGNLREPLSAMHRATVIAIPTDHAEIEATIKASGWQGPIWHLRRRMQVTPTDGPVVAFCGIARSDQFFAGLESAGLHLASRIAFADHHLYKVHDLDCIKDAARSVGAGSVFTTEKDRVRLGKLGESLPLKTATLIIEIENEDEAIAGLLKQLGS
jgi:tetraacyldisaccharide 4'-kinase